MENVITLGKLLSLWFYFLLLSILFLKTQTSCRTYKIISSNELARPVMGTIFLVYVVYLPFEKGSMGRTTQLTICVNHIHIVNEIRIY